MHRIVAIYGGQADPERFKRHYADTHLGLAGKLPGLLSSHHSFQVGSMTPNGDVFCVWVGEFADEAAADAALSSPEGEALAADIPNYVSGPLHMLRYTVPSGEPSR